MMKGGKGFGDRKKTEKVEVTIEGGPCLGSSVLDQRGVGIEKNEGKEVDGV